MCSSAPKPPPPQPPAQPPVIVEKAPEVKTGSGDATNKKKKVAGRDLRVPLGGGSKQTSGVGV